MRKSMKSIEQAIKEAEQLVVNANDIDILKPCLEKASEGTHISESRNKSFLRQKWQACGSDFDSKESTIGQVISAGAIQINRA